MKTLSTAAVCLTLAFLPMAGRAQTPAASPDAQVQAKTINVQGQAAYKAKDYAKAIADFRQALALDPQDESYVYNLGMADQKAGKFADGAQLLDAQMPKFPNDDDQKELRTLLADIHFFWGSSLDGKNDYQGAIGHYQLAYDIDKTLRHPDAGIDLANIGGDYDSLKQYPQAIQFYEQALEIKREVGDKKSIAVTLGNLGYTYRNAEDYDKAIPSYQEAISLDPTVESYVSGLARALQAVKRFPEGVQLLQDKLKAFPAADDQKELQIRLADMHFYWAKELEVSYDYQGAIGHYQLAYDIDKTLRHSDAGIDLNNMGSDCDSLSQYGQALKDYLLALPLKREVKDRSGEADTLSNIGNTYDHLDDYVKAIAYTQQAYAIDKTLRRKDAAIDLNNLGNFYDDTGQHETAIRTLNQALGIMREVKNRRGEGTTLNGLGLTYQNLHRYKESLDCYKQALAIRREVKDLNGEAVTLGNIGTVAFELEQYADATQYNQQSLILKREVHDRDGEATALSNLMLDLKYDGKPALAIFYGKQAVNTYQSIRADLQNLDASLQKGYLSANAATYRSLAEILISQGRLPEAQQVLGLLKQQEYFDFVERDAKQAGANGAASLTPQEAEWDRRYNEIADQVTALGAERGAMLAKTSLTPTEQKRLDVLEKDLEAANNHFQDLLTKLDQEAGTAPTATAKIEALRDAEGLQKTLGDLGAGTVALYTLVTDDKYHVLLLTSDTQKAEEYTIPKATLDQAILDFRESLQNKSVDPRPLGQALYKILFCDGALARDLEGAGAKTLMWSLDGNLRYLPVSALYDGRQYLVEKYRNTVFTPVSNANLKDPVSATWKALGLGVTTAHTVGAGKEAAYFPALPGAKAELDGIIGIAGVGVLRGTEQLDGAFTADTLRAALRQRCPLVHIASHFQFIPGDETNSYLLLGDGTTLSVKEINRLPGGFQGVELLTLSACNTAMGGATADGHEVEGFATLAQKKGADAVLASLWSVSDDSTSLLMQNFYRLREAIPGTTKAEALRQAQISLLRGTLLSKTTGKTTRAELATDPTDTGGQPLFIPDPKAPYAHPYFWAPFVLIGNWR